MKVWITKYALTEGIFQVETALSNLPCGSSGIVSYRRNGGTQQYAHGEGREWCRSLSDAIDRAEDLRDAKIKSLKKAIAKLESMTFTSAKDSLT